MKILSNIFILLFISSLIACSHTSNNSSNSINTIIQDDDESAQDSITIFGVKSERDPLEIINNLIDVELLTIDPDGLSIKNDSLKAAVVFFKGVGFGVTPQYRGGRLTGFNFISSRKDDNAYEQAKNVISSYYGETEDDEWHNCTWMKNEIYIKLRPLHTEEGGMVMIWSF